MTCKLRLQNPHRSQHLKGFMVVSRRRIPALRNEVVIDVDHPPDHPLQVPFGEHFIDRIGQIGLA